METNYLIVGSGPAGITAAENVRALDSQGKITVISEERVPMFYRPRIPEYAVGKIKIEELMVKEMNFYNQKRIELNLGVKAVRLDKKRKFVETSDGKHYGYGKLLVATGIDPVKPPYPGRKLKGIFTMHYLFQAEPVKFFVKEARHVVVVGGGLLGMDMAEELKNMGLEVDFLVRRHILGDPFFDEYGCKKVKAEFERLGVNVITGTEVRAFEGVGGKLAKIVTNDGREIKSSFCFLAIGGTPAVDWLRESGLEIDKGILVDEHLQSNEEGIFSAGNSAQIFDPIHKKQVVQTNWFNAMTQGRIAGNNMAGDEPIEYKSTTKYLKKVGTLSFHLIGLGNAMVKGGLRVYFKGDNPKEYILITMKDEVIVGAVICGLPMIILKLKDAIEKQKVIPNLEKLIDRKSTRLNSSHHSI